MRFPKLRHPTLCQLILYAPTLLPFALLFIGLFTEDFLNEKGLAGIYLGAVSILLLLSLVYLFGLMQYLFASDMVFAGIRSWKKGRRFYVSRKCGQSRKEAETILHRRSKLCGKEKVPSAIEPKPLWIRYRCRRCMTVFHSIEETISMTYSVDYLDMEMYRRIMRAAEVHAKACCRDPRTMFFLDKKQKKAPAVTAVAVILLADGVSFEIQEEILRKKPMFQDFCVRSCVADFGARRFYFDGSPEPYMLGMMGKPAQNYAISQIKRLVFGGRLPLRNNTEYLPIEIKDCSLDMTLWEFLRTMKGELKEVRFRDRRVANRLVDGGVVYRNELIYAKLGKRTATYLVEVDEKNEKKLTVLMGRMWTMPRTSKMKKTDHELLRCNIQRYLEAQGYDVCFDGENE